ncbi:hypothetical protein PsorP6_014463 [Peronosclerospora sorghi]|uniref:Uncharacterized protein n=1 Tax=Peronosclerospora sorghi TaxID=230839 RepID=A0ACC0VSV6_9STRA|nr:hypothetical protein PsorP6_014463 [Peronosclerospora sorghi]
MITLVLMLCVVPGVIIIIMSPILIATAHCSSSVLQVLSASVGGGDRSSSSSAGLSIMERSMRPVQLGTCVCLCAVSGSFFFGFVRVLLGRELELKASAETWNKAACVATRRNRYICSFVCHVTFYRKNCMKLHSEHFLAATKNSATQAQYVREDRLTNLAFQVRVVSSREICEFDQTPAIGTARNVSSSRQNHRSNTSFRIYNTINQLIVKDCPGALLCFVDVSQLYVIKCAQKCSSFALT